LIRGTPTGAGPAEAGAGDVGDTGVGDGRSSAVPRSSVLLLKLDANGFLQRAKRANFFG
jgi:hypothetical protein